MRNRTLWLTGIGSFTALLFSFLAFANFQFYSYQRDSYYLAGIVVFGAMAAVSIAGVVNGWRETLAARRALDKEGTEADERAD